MSESIFNMRSTVLVSMFPREIVESPNSSGARLDIRNFYGACQILAIQL